jgi:hypothetical protein
MEEYSSVVEKPRAKGGAFAIVEAERKGLD